MPAGALAIEAGFGMKSRTMDVNRADTLMCAHTIITNYRLYLVYFSK